MIDDNLIRNSKEKIRFLEESQAAVFRETVNQLNFNEVGEDWLFDYMYNTATEKTFSEYCQMVGKNIEFMVKNNH